MLTLSSPEKKTDALGYRDRALGPALAAQAGLSKMDSMCGKSQLQRAGLHELEGLHQNKSN